MTWYTKQSSESILIRKQLSEVLSYITFLMASDGAGKPSMLHDKERQSLVSKIYIITNIMASNIADGL